MTELDIVWAAHLAARALPASFAGYLNAHYFEQVRGELEEPLGGGRSAAARRPHRAHDDRQRRHRRRARAMDRRLDLMVLGSRGYGTLARVLLGSVSRAVVSDAACLVMIVGRGVTALEERSSREDDAASAADPAA